MSLSFPLQYIKNSDRVYYAVYNSCRITKYYTIVSAKLLWHGGLQTCLQTHVTSRQYSWALPSNRFAHFTAQCTLAIILSLAHGGVIRMPCPSGLLLRHFTMLAWSAEKYINYKKSLTLRMRKNYTVQNMCRQSFQQ